MAVLVTARGMSEKSVWLGDPSWGNRIISLPQFLAMWETREDDNTGQ